MAKFIAAPTDSSFDDSQIVLGSVPTWWSEAETDGVVPVGSAALANALLCAALTELI